MAMSLSACDHRPSRVEQIQDVVDYCHEQPEIRSWLDYFDDPPEEVVHDMDEYVRMANSYFDKDLAR